MNHAVILFVRAFKIEDFISRNFVISQINPTINYVGGYAL